MLVIPNISLAQMLDDVSCSAVRPDEFDPCRSEECDTGSIEANAHVEDGGVIGDDEGRARDHGHQLSDIGATDEVDDAGVVSCVGGDGLALLALAQGADDRDELDDAAVEEFL